MNFILPAKLDQVKSPNGVNRNDADRKEANRKITLLPRVKEGIAQQARKG